jgi:two-component system, NtrC family, response regulator AtoC
MTMHQLLIVDDEPNICRVLAAMLRRTGYNVRTASDGAQAMAELKLREYSVVITDLKMPRFDGMQLLHHVTHHYPDTPVIVITAHGSIGGAVDALKKGAFDYITKPFEQEEIQAAVEKAILTRERNREETHTGGGDDDGGGRFGIIGSTDAMSKVFTIIDKVASQPSTVLITGESGTGKELIAKALHEQGGRRSRAPFIKINCAAIPKDLMESELFGHEKGAFTGADNTKPGRFELADGGTLFLDEIGEVPVDMQVKLLRAIQESEFERVGGIKTISVDVRLVAATNRNLLDSIEEGTFREDLYYRLNVVPIHLAPLRERLADIPLLASHFVEKYNERLGKSITGISPSALTALQSYPWPGNIRELENLIERMILFADGDLIDEEDLPDDVIEKSSESPIPPIHLPAAAEAGLKEAVKATVSRLEKEYIAQALEETNHNVTRAAKLLKISRKSLQNKMKEFGLREE